MVYTGPPLAAVLLLVLPLLLMAWDLSLLTREVSWEVSDTHFRKAIGEKVVAEVPWRQAKLVMARGDLMDRMAVFSIADKNGKERLNAVPGVGLSFDDVQALYQAAAYYGEAFGIEAWNNLGWEPAAPTVPERRGISEKISVLPHVSVTLIVSGLLIFATGSYLARTSSADIGLGLVAIGGLWLGGSYFVRRHRRVSGPRRSLTRPPT